MTTPSPSTGAGPDAGADHKAQARRLRQSLADRGVDVGHSEALELVAGLHGARDWNTLAAGGPTPAASPRGGFGPVIPVLRIFDVAKAREFYAGFLGFVLDGEGTFDDHAPVYLRARRGDAVLHLSGHHGDASPGATARILVDDVVALHAELHGRDYADAKPGLEQEAWGRQVTVLDPFANRLVFHQPADDASRAPEGGGQAAGPIEERFEITRPPEHAWRVFIEQIGRWWHPAYAPPGLSDVVIEPRVGGRCVMVLADGSDHGWGTVTDFDAPAHYGQTFTLAQDPDHPSRLDVWFDAVAGGTVMRFAHGGWTPGNVAGRARFSEWSFVFDRFVACAEGREMQLRHPGETGGADG